jgi:hypothetical protein
MAGQAATTTTTTTATTATTAAIEIQKELNKPKKPGENGKYYTHVKPYLDEITGWLKEGFTDYSICEKLNISHQAWIDYKKAHTELIECYTRAQKARNALVYNKQYESAIGYSHKELYIAQYQGQIVEKEITKHYPPNERAAALFLVNNDPDFKTGREPVIQNNLNVTLDLPPEERDAEIARLLNQKTSEAETPEAIEAEYQIVDQEDMEDPENVMSPTTSSGSGPETDYEITSKSEDPPY